MLAGGKSSRMRKDKALLELGKGDLLTHQHKLLAQVVDNVLVSRTDETNNHIADKYFGFGPLAGVHASIAYIAKQYPTMMNKDAIVLPVDMPLISTELMQQLMNYGREFNLPCYFRDTNLPIYLPNVGSVLPKLERMLSNEQRIVHTFLDEIRAKSLVCHEPDKIANANTPMQWKLLKRAVESEG